MTHISFVVLSPASGEFVRSARKCRCGAGVYDPNYTGREASTDSVLPFFCVPRVEREKVERKQTIKINEIWPQNIN